jgi:hypothetical protein
MGVLNEKRCKRPIEKIITNLLNKCKYTNGESLERHNWWNENQIKLKYLPTNINSPSFEMDLLNAIDLNEDVKPNIELLWGDIQLGKRVHACIIMWFSVHVLGRPVLYIFRCLLIDQQQLQDDIIGTEKYNFNIQFIKNTFQEFSDEIIEEQKKKGIKFNPDCWKKFKLPELQDVRNNDTLNKLSNSDAINPTDIFCCLMHHKQLEKINSKLNENIINNKELVNMSVLVDESDLMTPTSFNDQSISSKTCNPALCEQLLAKIYKKVKYVLHITGTAHSLLYNITTKLSDEKNVQLPISKVHKMIRTEDYHGLFNDKITFNSEEIIPDEELTTEELNNKNENGVVTKRPIIDSWWEDTNTKTQKKKKYDIVEDYNINT